MKREKKSCRKKALFEPRQKIYGKNHRIKSNLLKSLMYIVQCTGKEFTNDEVYNLQ